MIKEWIDKQRAKGILQDVFKNGDIGIAYTYGQSKGKIYPKIHSVKFDHDNKCLEYVFTLPVGLDPKELKKKLYCFQQVFGKNIELEGEIKRYVLTVHASILPTEFNYNFKKFAPYFENMKLPILVGMDLNGEIIAYDMIKYPHLLIAGETGSGKSTQVRSVLSSLIMSVPPARLELYLCDLKRSEFHVFRNIEHVRGPFVTPKNMMPVFKKIQSEMKRRGDLLDQYEVAHVDDLPIEIPYFIVCIDEVALLQDEPKLMDLVEEISAIGRALGIFLILSMQRPDSKVLDGKLKVNLTVRMGFRTGDLINSRIIGTPGSEKLKVDGRLLLKLPMFSELKEIQAPYLALDKAKKLLEPYKSIKEKKPNMTTYKQNESYIDLYESENGIFEVLDE